MGEPTVPMSYQQVTYEEPTQAISGNGAAQHEPPARPVSEQPRSGQLFTARTGLPEIGVVLCERAAGLHRFCGGVSGFAVRLEPLYANLR